MSLPLRYTLIGAGGYGAMWCRSFLPPLAAAGKAVCVAAVDTNPEAFKAAQQYLHLPPQYCFSDPGEAFDRRKADFVIICTPPKEHEKLIALSLIYELDILLEPPLADSLVTACRIFLKVKHARHRKMALAMGHRYDQDKQTLERLVKSNQYGRLNYVIARTAHNYRKRGLWGRGRHEMDHPAFIEGAAHHVDIFRALSASDPKSVYTVSWNPPWGDFRGDSTLLMTIEMQNGVHCLYEAAFANASMMNGWGNEYVRAECEHGTLELDHRSVRLFKGSANEEPRITDLPLAEQPLWSNAWLTDTFCDWLRGGPKVANRLSDAMQSTGLVFAAIESARIGKPVDVMEYLNQHLQTVQWREKKPGAT
jgi:predicted dehydrogenase